MLRVGLMLHVADALTGQEQRAHGLGIRHQAPVPGTSVHSLLQTYVQHVKKVKYVFL